MRKLFIIGNGFDLAHGLKTSYADFVLWFINKMVRRLKAAHGSTQIHPLLTISQTGYGIKEFNSMDKLKKAIDNHWIELEFKFYFFQELFYKYLDANWVDVEYEYYQSLLVIYRRFERENNLDKENVKDLNTCLDLIKMELSEYLQSILKVEEPKDSILKNFRIEMSNVTPDDTRLLVFNYTDTVLIYTKLLGIRSENIIFIHGKLQDQTNPIVFGYGDEMDEYYGKIERLNYNEILRNMKSYSYFKAINYQSFSRFINNGDFNVIIMGHSCGISDRVLLNSIFCNSKCKEIKIYYHKRNEMDNDYFEKTQEISRHFKPEDKGRMRDLIVPFPQSNPLSE